MISLGYKKPFPNLFFALLLYVLFILSCIILMIEALYYDFPPKELIGLFFFIIFIQIFAFYFNVFFYPVFVKRLASLIKKNIGLPMSIEAFTQLTGVSQEWLEEHHIDFVQINELELRYLILLYNKKSANFHRTQLWIGNFFNLILDPADYFKRVEESKKEQRDAPEKTEIYDAEETGEN